MQREGKRGDLRRRGGKEKNGSALLLIERVERDRELVRELQLVETLAEPRRLRLGPVRRTVDEEKTSEQLRTLIGRDGVRAGELLHLRFIYLIALQPTT